MASGQNEQTIFKVSITSNKPINTSIIDQDNKEEDDVSFEINNLYECMTSAWDRREVWNLCALVLSNHMSIWVDHSFQKTIRRGQTHSWLAQAAENLQSIADQNRATSSVTSQQSHAGRKSLGADALPRSPLRETISAPIFTPVEHQRPLKVSVNIHFFVFIHPPHYRLSKCCVGSSYLAVLYRYSNPTATGNLALEIYSQQLLNTHI